MRSKLWQITENGPSSLKESEISLEEHLEDWIEGDPTLLREGLTIVGRQVHVDGGYIDLLALDPLGRWTVIELKRGNIDRGTIAQAIDYASCIESMSFQELKGKIHSYLAGKGIDIDQMLKDRGVSESSDNDERDISLFAVGTGRAPGLERMVGFLSSKGEIDIEVVLFDVFENPDGQRIMVREVTETEEVPKKTRISTIEELQQLAKNEGVGAEFMAIFNAALELGLYPRPWKVSMMYAPQENKTRALFTVWAKPTSKGIQIWMGPKAFNEFFGIDEHKYMEKFGQNDWHHLGKDEISAFVTNLTELLKDADKN